MTDLELIDKYCEECINFVDPRLFREIRSRGLYDIINYLPKDTEEAKAVARLRLREQGKYFDEPEIDEIANKVMRINYLRNKLNNMNMADVHKTMPLLDEMTELSKFVRDYYK